MTTAARAALAAATCAALVLASCGGSDEAGDGGARATAQAKTLESDQADGAKGTVTFCVGKDTTGSISESIELFNKQDPDVQARLRELPPVADEQRTQLVQRLRARSSECDLLGLDVIWTAEFAAHGWLYDITPVIERRRSEFIPSTLETAKYDDKYWAMPYNANAAFLYYRSDQIDSAPQSWEDVYAEGSENDGFVYAAARYEGLTVNFLELLFSAGGQVLSDDGSKVQIDSPAARRVMRFMVDGIENGAVPQAVRTYREEETRLAFESGNASLERNWPYAYALGNQSAIKGKFEITPLPGFEGEQGAGVLGGYNLGISAYSANPGTALAFASFLTGPDAQRIAAERSFPPTLTATYSDPAVKKALPFAHELLQAIQQARPRPVSPVYPQISEAIYTNAFDAISGKLDPDTAVSQMSGEIEEALKTF